MNEHWSATVSDAELEGALRSVARQLDAPDVDLSTRVSERIREAPTTTRGWALGYRVLAFAASALLAAVGILLFSPAARDAVADLFGIDGIVIEFDDEPPPDLGGELSLGEEVSLPEVRERVGFEVVVPADEDLGPPDAVYVSTQISGGLVSFVFDRADGLPEADETGVGALLMQFEADPLGPDLVKKVSGPGTRLQPVTVEGAAGYWIAGEPHALMFEDNRGVVREQRGRLAGNTLLWSDGGVTYRLESRLSLGRSLEIAGSLR